MNEADFWVHLEYRVCSEFAGMPEKRLQQFWCDGFIPGEYVLNGPSPRINGQCWICDGPKQAAWEFALLLPKPIRSREDIDWGTLLPSENVTHWMVCDERRQYIEIEPALAVPDRD
jgi:hypothetical protein